MKILLTLILLISNFAFAAKSLEWQKIELERDIRNQYEQVLLSVTERKNFLVRSEVKYSDPGMPRFNDLNEDNLRISDISFDESKGDYIAFSKIGLEVPVLGKAFRDNQRQLKEMYRYNESYDIFKNIQSLDVQITLNSNLAEVTVTNIKKVVETFKLSIVNFAPKVEFINADLSDGIAPTEDLKVEEEFSMKDIFEFIGKFGNAFGMIATVLLLGFLAFKLLRTYMEFVERMNAMETPPQKEEKSEEDNKQELEQAMELEHESLENLLGIERFEKLIELNLDQAVYLIKKWIVSGGSEERLALSAVAQQLEHKDLEKIYSRLDSEKRSLWNDQIEDYLEGAILQDVNRFVSEEVVRELVAGSVLEDYELMDILLNMNKSAVKEYILTSNEFGPFLSNCLSSNILAQLMNDLSPKELDKVVSESMSLNQSSLISKLSEFKKDLVMFCDKFKASTFSTKLLGVVSEISTEKETLIYSYLIEQGNGHELKKIAVENIPSALVFDLPEDFVKSTLTDYPLDRKIELLASVDDESREKLLVLVAPANSSAREMIEMEMEILMGDELKLARIKKNSSVSLQKYVNFTRDALKTKPEYNEQIEEIVDMWITNMSKSDKVTAIA